MLFKAICEDLKQRSGDGEIVIIVPDTMYLQYMVQQMIPDVILDVYSALAEPPEHIKALILVNILPEEVPGYVERIKNDTDTLVTVYTGQPCIQERMNAYTGINQKQGT